MNFLLPSVAIDPIHQFQVSKWLDLNIGGVDLSFTNASGFMLLGVVLTIAFFGVAASKGLLVPSRLQSMAEIGYGFVADMVRGAAGEEGLKFFPFVFTLFFFLFFANMIGMVPYAFTTTSHVIVTGALALLVISIVIGYGFYKNGLKFFKLFAPSGAPFLIYFLLVPIEVISFFARPLTLALRLFANMLAGHIMLKLFAGFAVSLIGAGIAYIPVAILAFSMGVALNALEFLVAGLQAYVFAILTCVYLNDALHPSH
ncbi:MULTISPECIES: F0F1 ATP synthase subunit A [Hyphomonas]|uniref:ATP synthase subunit a n=2 Tax=Hyphomonas adhaerens TaxID=81029 RepID=A0A069E6L3_9PROT|nr:MULTISPECIES: F0F1 ATP synthase subunit A [Hyphomonas]KCZ85940.1 F0F1 ATP synthase subunit A [Hyphomonas adhaerens MHS-3]MBB40836.1 F0F1 ATP synthase subunit A [Hyphomonas sp.]HAE28700.1 F0F1 ATP synthase subunit A [Hyphomonas adhaerens]|tara:strand:+ start:1033 stop:1803 length:771 start_codon:yes stop_codon:yes gene_type:complete